MSDRSHRLSWVAPLLVGACAAIAAAVAGVILLYAGPGFVRSLTTVLAVEGVALGGGLWSAPSTGSDLIDRLRRRWLLCLVAFLAATMFATSWSAVQDLGAGRVGQGLGLVMLAALPLYACGTVLGGLSSVAASDPSGRLRGPGAAAVLGAGLGFAATGTLLLRAPIIPASLLVACLVLLSLGGMVTGIVLGSRLEIHVRASRAARGGEVRVEDRRLPKMGLAVRCLLEGEHVRRRMALNGEGVVPWDVAVARAVMPAESSPWRVLVLGGGTSSLARTILREHPSGTIEVLERTGAVVELARDHLDTDLTPGLAERVNVRVGNVEDLLAEVRGPYDLVVVDTSALAPMGGISALSRAARTVLVSVLGDAGLLAWGPLEPEPGMPELVSEWRHVILGRTHAQEEEVVILTGPGDLAPFSTPLDGFIPMNGGLPAQ